jgi:hypothetical protein
MRENKKFLESNENKNITYQNIWDIKKAVLRGNSYEHLYKKFKDFKKNHLMLYLKLLEKQEQAKPQITR